MEAPLKIITGGQTGVDRGAMDGALEAGVPCGGRCPAGRLDEFGRIPERYPLTEMPQDGALDRTVQNILDAQATVIIYFGALSGGTEETLLHCILLRRPYLLIDGNVQDAGAAAASIRTFLRVRGVHLLNVAGPRASEEARGYDFARQSIRELANFVSASNSLSGKGARS